MRKVERTRQFPAVEIGAIVLGDGECALLSEQSRMFGEPDHKARTTGGTLVMVGKQPFYFGRSEPFTRGFLDAAPHGRLTLTNRALLFSGSTRTFTVDLATLKTIEPYSREAVIVSTCGSAKGVIFSVCNPILWSMVVRVTSTVPLSDQRLPDRLNFDHGSASQVQAA